MKRNKKFLLLFAMCFIFTLGNFCLHIAPSSNTMINYVDKKKPVTDDFLIKDGFTNWAVNYHKTLPDFKKRPVTTALVELTAKWFSLRIGVAFVWVNYFFLFISGFLVYYLALLYSKTHRYSIISVAFFYTCFSILLAYFIPIATYDEPAQYFFILLSLIALKKRFLILFSLLFGAAIIARENSLLMLPAIFFFLTDFSFKNISKEKVHTLKIMLACLIPIIIYGGYLTWFFTEYPETVQGTSSSLNTKLSVYKKNFRDVENISRTLLSFTSVFLLPLFLLVYYQLKSKSNEVTQNLTRAFWMTFFINTPIIMFVVFAEESRVFTLPILFIVPVAGKIITDLVSFNKEFIQYLFNYKRVLITLVIIVLSWVFFDQAYELTNLNMNENLYQEYNTIACSFIGLIITYQTYLKKKAPTF